MSSIPYRWLVAACIVVLLAGLGAYTQRQRLFVMPEKRALILTVFRDPDSAKFRDEFIHGSHLCGEVNSKNAAGGYVGYTRFISDGTDWALDTNDRTTLEQKLQHNNFEILWLTRCKIAS